MDKSVLILAAGQQSRWENDGGYGFKQLLYAGTETILGRIVRQVSERGAIPIIVTHKSALLLPGAEPAFPQERRWKVESLLSIWRHWRSTGAIVLLGDVIYQGHVMDRIMEWHGGDRFWGNYAEIFAFTIRNTELARKRLLIALRRCVRHGDKGTLHSLLRAYANDWTTDYETLKNYQMLFTHVTGDGGWTRDIDTPDDYELFIEQVVMPGKLDDLP